MSIKPHLIDTLGDFEKMYQTRFDWESQHTVWMLDLETEQWVLLSTKEDPAELVSYAVSSSVYSQSIMVLHGWAAPFDSDTSPSKHEERRRVRVFIHIESGEVSFAHQFSDSANEIHLLENPLGGHFMDLIEDAIEYTRENHPSLPETFLSNR